MDRRSEGPRFAVTIISSNLGYQVGTKMKTLGFSTEAERAHNLLELSSLANKLGSKTNRSQTKQGHKITKLIVAKQG